VDVTSKVLYITYDGLTDPLGQSQILPYLKGLSANGIKFTILSFEKRDRFQKERQLIEHLTNESGIKWVPLTFTSKPPLLSKLYDALRMKAKAIALHKEHNFDMVHCRSYIAADVGLALKQRFGVKFFFDMRGFWADEKRDGSWNINNPLYAQVYKYYKSKEAKYLQCADQIITLTEAARKEMMTWKNFDDQRPLMVIPCCTDMVHFGVTDQDQRAEARRFLDLDKEPLVMSYLGSIGTWYMLDEMLAFFKQLQASYRASKFLILTHSNPEVILTKARLLGIPAEDLILREAPRKLVPFLLKASDINISFIRPVYSKISSSPTKLGEVLSMGIPIITNGGVGDVEQIVHQTGAGFVLKSFDKDQYDKAIKEIPALLKKDPSSIREKASKIFSLQQGVQSYLQCYNRVLNNNPVRASQVS
jgi:glycosyltransferase involved in cell wall biosynthesis